MLHVKKIGEGVVATLLWLLCFCIVAGADEVQVVGIVDRNEMHQGDTFTYSIKASSSSSVNVGQPQLPELSAFEVLNTWSGSEARSTFTNGTFQVEQSRTFNYLLSPKKAGALSIGAATVEVNGQSYKTQPISIKVLEGSAPQMGQAQPAPGQPQDPFEEADNLFDQLLRRRGGGDPGTRTQPENLNDQFFIQVEVDKAKVYAGEQVTATWYLYTRAQIRDIDTIKYPSLSGFWKEDIALATRLDFQQEVINGVPWQKALLASFALFPIKKGVVTIDEYKARCTLVSMSGFGFGQAQQITKASEPVRIDVKELPTQGKPASFSGAVGLYTVSGSLDQSTVPANQPVTLKIRYEGRGNAKLIELPPLNLPPTIEVYDSKGESKFAKDGTSYKQFEVVLLPRQAGEVIIPPLNLSAFDPNSGKYYEQKSQELKLTVTPASADSSIAAQPLAQNTPVKANQELMLPQLALEWQSRAQGLKGSKNFIWAFIYLGVFAFLGWRYFVEFGLTEKRKSILDLFNKRITEINALVGGEQWRQVGAEATNLVYYIIGDVSGEGGAHDSLEKMLAKAPPSVRREAGDELLKLMGYFEALGFAPEGVVGQLKEKSTMKKRVSELETLLLKAIKASGRITETTPQAGENPV